MLEDEFEDYVRARAGRLRRAAFALCGDWHHAEDLVQTALVKAHPALVSGRAEQPDAYVARTLINSHRSWRRRLWHGERPTARLPEQVAPGLATAHVVLPLAVTGTVDENQVDAVLDVLVRRHEALHTVVRVAPEPTLRPRPEAGVPVERHDLRGVDEAGQERRSRQLALEAYRRPFDLTTDLPVRATWIRLADERSILLLTLHHIACDGVSLRILAHDAERAFAGAALAPVGLGYRDYAAWQQARWRSGALRPELDHWLRVLGTDRVPMVWSRPAGPAQQRTYRYEAAVLQAPVELADGVDMTAKVHSTTPFVVLCAALAAVAARTTGAGEAALGALTANRVRAEFDSTVGLFAGTVVLRVPVARGTSFAGLLKEVHEATMVAHAHQELPLDLVVEHLHEQGYAGPVYDLGLSVDWEPATPAPGTPGAPGVSVLPLDGSDIPMGVAIGAAPLTLSVTRRTTSLSLRAEYSTDELDEARVRSLLDDLVSLLRRAHVEPATPVSA